MQNNVLITHGIRPFAQRIARTLPEAYRPFFGSAEDIPSVLLNRDNFLRIPQVNEPVFIHEVLKRCLDNGIVSVIPLGIDELYPLAEARPLFSEYGIEIWVPDVTALAELPVIPNPSKQLPLVLLCDGMAITDGNRDRRFEGLSGVFTPSDSGDELALCCIAD